MFGFNKQRLVDEKFITDVNLELARLSREVSTLKSDYDNLYDLIMSFKGRTNRKKKEDAEEEETVTKSILLPT